MAEERYTINTITPNRFALRKNMTLNCGGVEEDSSTHRFDSNWLHHLLMSYCIPVFKCLIDRTM